MNKRLNHIKMFLSVIAMVSLILILIGTNTTIIPDKIFTISVVVFLLSALVLFLCIIITFAMLLIHKKLQKYLKRHWKEVIINWAVTCVAICICLMIKDGFSYSILWCIPGSLAIELFQITIHDDIT